MFSEPNGRMYVDASSVKTDGVLFRTASAPYGDYVLLSVKQVKELIKYLGLKVGRNHHG